MPKKKTPESMAKEIIKLRGEGLSDKAIAREHPELEPGFKLANLQAGGTTEAPRPRGSGAVKTTEHRAVAAPEAPC